ncbi:hypothetical protein T02_9 [Trichinella nativa]|uniref:DDE-1 domain-containing protein n=1 Tax=Trichinella nativa TaxID=6335 RepID=A0A0V1KJQ9_9BILA|nr:hypothetical protein T02_9 [Trichinella nativa]
MLSQMSDLERSQDSVDLVPMLLLPVPKFFLLFLQVNKSFKSCKESVPLLYCVISGDCDGLQPLLVGKSKRSRPMIGVQKLPVVYDYQQKAWMTGNIFS